MKEPVALIFDDKGKLVKGFTEYFVKLLHENLPGRQAESGIFTVALSGGSTPKIWFEYLAKNYADKIDWKRIHFYWGDERCVPPDDAESNFGMTKTYLLDHIDIPEENIHRISGEKNPDDAAAIYSKEISQQLSHEKIPIFDLVILGMGDDGHTASIFPHEIQLWDSDAFCVVANHPVSGQQRVSITGKVINNARAVAFLVIGNSKSERIKEIFDEEPHASYYPASLVKPVNSQLHWFLDGEAASLIQE